MNRIKIFRLNILSFQTAFTLPLLLASIGFVSGCAQTNYTKPRSEILEEAEDNGLSLPSVEEDRERFLSFQKEQSRRILSLVRKRANQTSGDTNYRVGPGDEIEVNVFDVPELNVTARVKPSGFLSLPLIGALEAGGNTEEEISQTVKKRLSSFVRDPQVKIFVSNYGSQKVAVLGAVSKPGTYPLRKGANSLLEMLSEAGGLSNEAGNFLNFIPAEVSGLGASSQAEARARFALASFEQEKLKNSAIELPLNQILGTSGGIPIEVAVKGGDMIVIPEKGQITVEGEVEKRGSYELKRGMTLLGALAAAGGITYSAKFDEVELIRDIGNSEKARLIVNLEDLGNGDTKDVVMRNGDIVRVPSHSGRRIRKNTFDGIARMINFGVGGSVNMAP